MGMTHSQIPLMDETGRLSTLNAMGKVDPHPNAITDAFVEWAAAKAPHAPVGSLYKHQMHVLEIGGGFGFVGERILRRGGFLLFNDFSEAHCEIADKFILGSVDTVNPSQFHCIPGKFPEEFPFEEIQEYFPIVGVGIFQVLHFQTPQEIRTTLDRVWDLLRPGGRVFVTAGTPWNRAFRGFPPLYRERKARFFRAPSLDRVFPGELPNAWDYLPKEEYPAYFHGLDGDTLGFLAMANPAKAFRLVEMRMMERPIPRNQAYRRGYARGQTELVGVILEKPGI